MTVTELILIFCLWFFGGLFLGLFLGGFVSGVLTGRRKKKKQ